MSEKPTYSTRMRSRQDAFERFKEEMKQAADFATFEGRIKELERVCLNTPGMGLGGVDEPKPSNRSRAWYAEKILVTIGLVRDFLRRGQADYAASEAVMVGVWAEEAEARHNWPEVRKWSKLCEQNSKSAKDRGRKVSDAAKKLAEALQSAALEYRSTHPYKPPANSTRAMARHLARKLGKNENTIRHHLQKLGIQ